MKLKHNKLRNTGLIFELLTKKLTEETLKGVPTLSAKLIQKNFTPDSQLVKELGLYFELTSIDVKNSNELLEFSLSVKNQIDLKKLHEEKYKLIAEIKKVYDLDSFFGMRSDNYKMYGNVFKLLEYSGIENPSEYLDIKKQVLEHISSKGERLDEDVVMFGKEPADIRSLALCTMVENFNEHYDSIPTHQKRILSKYINDDIRSDSFKNFVVEEICNINGKINMISRNIEDKIMKIKLKECSSLTETILTAKVIKEEHVSSLIKFYELIDTLEG